MESASFKELVDFFNYAEISENEKRNWQEWLAFAPLTGMAGEVMEYKTFCKTTEKKKRIGDDVFEEIRRRFNL